jgi:hypothetical protein
MHFSLCRINRGQICAVRNRYLIHERRRASEGGAEEWRAGASAAVSGTVAVAILYSGQSLSPQYQPKIANNVYESKGYGKRRIVGTYIA